MKRNWSAWESFLSDLQTKQGELGFEPGEECFYRGHADGSWPLQPTLMRRGGSADALGGLEADLFFEFQARARELHHQNLTDWDVLFFMRHHGVPTRLLDWTDSLGVALFFAVQPAGPAARPPCVWLLNPYALNEETLADRDLITPRNLGWDEGDSYYYDYGELLLEPDGFDWDVPLALYPQQKSARSGAQRGWFTIHGAKHQAMETLCPKVVRRIDLSAEAVEMAREFLALMGIDRYLLFQDLDGLAAALCEKYGLGSPAASSASPRRERRRSQKRA